MTETGPLPIGVCLRSIRAEPGWWLESAVRLDEAGYAGLWSWDHFMGRGESTVPVVESWTILAMAAARTARVTVGPFVM
ncbi:MAG: Luciferase-like monooxygenase, partial [Chloroflexota bacterium]|nr:Luciferase-like monooxygenase [Chloroflexota bacterium]